MKKIICALLISFWSFILTFETLAVIKERSSEGVLNKLDKFLLILEKKWKEEVLPVFEKLWSWFKENIWKKILYLLKSEYEKRKDEIKHEFKRKEKEIKGEIKTQLSKIQLSKIMNVILERTFPFFKQFFKGDKIEKQNNLDNKVFSLIINI